jgi:hypothetical protein
MAIIKLVGRVIEDAHIAFVRHLTGVEITFFLRDIPNTSQIFWSHQIVFIFLSIRI